MAGTAIEIGTLYSPDFLATPGPRELTVVVPAHNTEKRISRVVSNLAAQTLPENILRRVIICANACEDRTAAVAFEALERFRQVHPGSQVRVIESPTSGEANALNTMLADIPSTDFVISLNDDVFPTKYSIAALYAAMVDNPTLGVIGVKNVPLKVSKKRPMCQFSVEIAEMLTTPKPGSLKILGRLCAFRPEIIGPFPDIVSIDSYLMYMSLINSDGYGILNDNQSFVYYRLPSRLLDVLRQLIIYKKGNAQFSRDFPEYESVRYKPEDKDINRTMLVQSKHSLFHKAVSRILVTLAERLAASEARRNPQVSSKRSRIPSTV